MKQKLCRHKKIKKDGVTEVDSKEVVVWMQGGKAVKLFSAALKNPEVFKAPAGHSHRSLFEHQSKLFLLANE